MIIPFHSIMAEASSSSRPSTWSCTSSNFTTVVSLLRQAETLLQSSVNPVAQQSSAEANECSSSATADQNRSLPYALALPLFRAGWAICWSTDEAQKREWRFCCKRNVLTRVFLSGEPLLVTCALQKWKVPLARRRTQDENNRLPPQRPTSRLCRKDGISLSET